MSSVLRIFVPLFVLLIISFYYTSNQSFRLLPFLLSLSLRTTTVLIQVSHAHVPVTLLLMLLSGQDDGFDFSLLIIYVSDIFVALFVILCSSFCFYWSFLSILRRTTPLINRSVFFISTFSLLTKCTIIFSLLLTYSWSVSPFIFLLSLLSFLLPLFVTIYNTP